MSTAREIQQRAQEAEARRATEIAERAKVNGTARGPAPVIVRHDPSIIRQQPPEDPHAAKEPVELRVIRFMAQHGTCTAARIADGLGVSKPRVTSALGKLIEAQKCVEEHEPKQQARGRPAKQYTLLDGADEELESAEVPDPDEGMQTASPSPQEPFADVDLGTATCEYEPCGEEFTKKHPRQKFCDLICRERATRARRDRSQRPLHEPRECARDGCRYDFTPDSPAQKFCSDECRAEDENARKIDERRQRKQRASMAAEEAPTDVTTNGHSHESLESFERRYFDLLMAKAELEEDSDVAAGLYDRLEKLIEARIA